MVSPISTKPPESQTFPHLCGKSPNSCPCLPFPSPCMGTALAEGPMTSCCTAGGQVLALTSQDLRQRPSRSPHGHHLLLSLPPSQGLILSVPALNHVGMIPISTCSPDVPQNSKCLSPTYTSKGFKTEHVQTTALDLLLPVPPLFLTGNSHCKVPPDS